MLTQCQGQPNHEYFVLKRYEPSYSDDAYRNELKTFHFISNQSMEREASETFIGFYGSYVHNRICYVVLEYADHGTLEDMFQELAPPKTVQQITCMWRSLFGLVTALKTLHMTTARSPDNQLYTYAGYVISYT